MNKKITESIVWGNKTLILETGELAKQADGAVLVKYGLTTVLCSVVYAKEPAEQVDFFPLTTNYQERFYAAGKLPGGFVKREGKPSERETLISRLIDRAIRPLFPSGFFNEVQVICTLLSYDPECSPEVAAMIGASAAISISEIPFEGPIAGCRVGYDPNEGYVLNPSNASDMDLAVAGTSDGVLMVESELNELPEAVVLDAVMFGFESIQPVIQLIRELTERSGKQKIQVTALEELHQDIFQHLERKVNKDISGALDIKQKLERRAALEKIKNETLEKYDEKLAPIASKFFDQIISQTMRKKLFKKRERLDGRAPEDIRPISCRIDVLPQVHGSALFTRGETQALVVTTLASLNDTQMVDNVSGEQSENFLLHYNFLPFSVGEIGRLAAPGRREIGHGKLALRAIQAMLPPPEVFPYTIRVVSEIVESNGSSSMATVCGTSLSLMAAGVPLKKPVAGIAMGLVKNGNSFIVLSDIMGDEDHFGDMDFKVAGTENGVTALQMDIKITSITKEIMQKALEQAQKGRMHILDKMNNVINCSRAELSATAPRVQSINIDKNRIKDLIGPGGKVIKDICERLKVKIDIAEDGKVSVYALDRSCMSKAIGEIRAICTPAEVGQVVTGTVKNITDFGAFIAFGSHEGLLHKSKIMTDRPFENVSDVLRVGQTLSVRIIEIDAKNRIKFAMAK